MSAGGALATAPPAGAGWCASLALEFARDGEATRLARRNHRGPLLVQRPLCPEGPGVCQCVIVHPPGGIVGGDRLEILAAVGAAASAQLTTPGAAKWYRSAGAEATQRIELAIAAGASLEWMPQGNIVFDGARLSTQMSVHLAGTASTFIGWDAWSLGRHAAGERFSQGQVRQRIDIFRDDALIWSERFVLDAGSPMLASPAGLNDLPIFGTFVAVGRSIDDDMLMRCRERVPGGGECAVSRLPDALVARYRGASMESLHAAFAGLWSIVRPALLQRAALAPRIWST